MSSFHSSSKKVPTTRKKKKKLPPWKGITARVNKRIIYKCNFHLYTLDTQQIDNAERYYMFYAFTSARRVMSRAWVTYITCISCEVIFHTLYNARHIYARSIDYAVIYICYVTRMWYFCQRLYMHFIRKCQYWHEIRLLLSKYSLQKKKFNLLNCDFIFLFFYRFRTNSFQFSSEILSTRSVEVKRRDNSISDLSAIKEGSSSRSTLLQSRRSFLTRCLHRTKWVNQFFFDIFVEQTWM